MSGSQEENVLHMDTVIVQVKQGKLRGTIRYSVYNTLYVSFLNIPYAAPPIGYLRFKDPQPPACWEGIRDANKDENVCCAQMTRYPKYDFIGSEDCLYLNIYIPCRIREKTGIAVMVWIHGGYFFSGSGNFTDARPDYLINEDIILVTVNYRLGAFGFLNLRHVLASGNQGLKDQVAALQWIKENIAVFGGDPNNVTVFGSNVGAVCVHLLMLSPLSKDLFHKAILQGGVATMRWATEPCAPISYSYRLATELGCKSSNPEDIVEFLNKLPAIDIVSVQFSMINTPEANMCRVIFGPSLDIYAVCPFLPLAPHELLDNGNHIPVILGHTYCEYLRFLDESTESRLLTLYLTLPIHVRTVLPWNASKLFAMQVAQRCQKYYFNNVWPTSSSLQVVLRCYNAIYFDIPIRMIADQRRKLAKAPTFVYAFSYVGNQKMIDKNLYWYNVDLPVSSQGDDLAYLFFMPKGGNISPPDPETDDFKMIEIMTSMWTHFARTGVPVGDRYSPMWEPATKKSFYYLDINTQGQHFDLSATIAFYDTILQK